MTAVGVLIIVAAYLSYRAWLYSRGLVYREVPRVGVEELAQKLNSEEAEKILDAQRKTKSQQLNAEGFKAYGNGRLREAQAIWQQALVLDPENKNLVEQISMVGREISLQGKPSP